MMWAIVILIGVLVSAGYWWSSQHGRGVDRQALYDLRVRDSRKVAGRNIGGGGSGGGRR